MQDSMSVDGLFFDDYSLANCLTALVAQKEYYLEQSRGLLEGEGEDQYLDAYVAVATTFVVVEKIASVDDPFPLEEYWAAK